MTNRLHASMVRNDRKDQRPLGIALIDADTGKVCQVNAKFIEMFGNCGQVDLVRLKHSDLLAPDRDALVKLRDGEIDCINIDQRYLQLDGSFFWINIKISLFTGTDNANPCLLWLVDDVTEARQRQEA